MDTHSQHTGQSTIPLLVDLDGSLIKTDTLFELVILYIKNKPWMIVMLAVWLLQGKARLKEALYERTSLNIDILPYDQTIIEYLIREQQRGREILLCTGTWQPLAERIAQRFTFFSGVHGSTPHCNLTGSNKANLCLDTYGEKGFDYLGNEKKDLKIWRHARQAIVVGDKSLEQQAKQVCTVEHYFYTPKSSLKIWLKAIRIHQWSKNLLLGVPLIAAQHRIELSQLWIIAWAFLCFGLCASATYILNDLFDLEADRLHSTKCKRPLAAGTLGIPPACIGGALLLSIGLFIAVQIGLLFVAALALYLAITILYSFKLKKMQTIDVITLASLFTLRVLAGGAALSIPLSFWLLCFSMFIFLSLAIVKRVAELIRKQQESADDNIKVSGRGYYTADIVVLQCLGGTSGFLAVLVFALYINSPEILGRYRFPEALWLMCPILGYWIMRIWMLTARGHMNEDPISFALKDKNSWTAALLSAAVILTANQVWPV